MAKFDVSQAELTSALGSQLGPKVYAALKKSIERHDYDSGWVATPAGGVFTHNLGTLPNKTRVRYSANADGNPYAEQSAVVVTPSQITTPGTAGFYRVTADR